MSRTESKLNIELTMTVNGAISMPNVQWYSGAVISEISAVIVLPAEFKNGISNPSYITSLLEET